MKLFLSTIRKYIVVFIINLIVNTTYFLLVRSDKNNVFRNLYSIHKYLLKWISVYPYKTINHQLYTERHSTSSIQTVISNRIGFTSNLVFGLEKADFSLTSIEIPNIYIAKHKNVKIQGNSDFIIDKDEGVIINDFTYEIHPKFDNCDGTLLKQKNNFVLLKYNDENCDRNLESGIILSGKFSSNYYHMIYEILIKLLVLDEISIPDIVPLVVDSTVFEIESFRQIFKTLNRTKREVILIDRKEVISFKNLYWISAVNIIPPNIKNPLDCSVEDVKYDLSMLNRMRERLLTIKSNRKFPDKLFITRKIFKRRGFNEIEVISLLKEYGFSIVAPEEYTFSEQIALFNGAKFIVGGSGASLSNLLFCSEGCKVICLYSLKINSPVFTTIAYSQGVDMRHCIGIPDKLSVVGNLHADFHIDKEELKQMLDILLK